MESLVKATAMLLLSVALLFTMAASRGIKSESAREKRIPGLLPDNAPTPVRDPCYSNSSNTSLPAAHIKGRGSDVWKVENGKITPQWDCESSGVGSAFVAGGMWFSHEENSLNVPVCGWYYVTSQITFRGNREQAQQFAHTLNVERNCNSTSRLTATYTRTSYTTIPPLDDGTRGKSSTILSDVVKICEGGKIFVSIPSYSCCPLASESSTSIAAYLVSESDCYWPLLTSKPEQFQRSQR